MSIQYHNDGQRGEIKAGQERVSFCTRYILYAGSVRIMGEDCRRWGLRVGKVDHNMQPFILLGRTG